MRLIMSYPDKLEPVDLVTQLHTREIEVRVFVEGAEVSPYLRGTIQTTGGMNTCAFTLNNNHALTKHDCVRVFARLPHISGIVCFGGQDKKKIIEVWTPVFTGFVDEVDWEDDPVMNIQCCDWYDLLNRTQVRVQGNLN